MFLCSPVSHCLLAPDLSFYTLLRGAGAGRLPVNSYSALPATSVSGSVNRGTRERNQGLSSSFLWELRPCSTSSPWQQQLHPRTAVKFGLQFSNNCGSFITPSSENPASARRCFCSEFGSQPPRASLPDSETPARAKQAGLLLKV